MKPEGTNCNNCLNIQNPSSLTAEEKYAILAAYTGNVTYDSFAAEVEFHSDALVDWKKTSSILEKLNGIMRQ